MRQGQRPDEILVVDSGSSDATVAIASAFPTTIVHVEPDDFSFGAACNAGCEAATGDIVVFVSAHCYPVYDGWLECLCEPFDDEAIACSYGRQIAPPEARFSEQRLFARWYPSTPAHPQFDPFCNNANAAIRRSVWEDHLRYDERLTGLEDLDWAKRAIARGYALSYVPDAPVVHVHEESVSEVVNRYRREAIAHRQIYGDQAIGAAHAIQLASAHIVRDYAAARASGKLWDNLADIPRFRLAQFYGTYRGFAQIGPIPDVLRRRFFYPDGRRRRPEPESPVRGASVDYDRPLDPSEL